MLAHTLSPRRRRGFSSVARRRCPEPFDRREGRSSAATPPSDQAPRQHKQALFALPVRIIGIVSAVLFIITAAKIFMGEQLLPTSTPLPADAYQFLVATFIGWIWMLWRSEKLDGAQT